MTAYSGPVKSPEYTVSTVCLTVCGQSPHCVSLLCSAASSDQDDHSGCQNGCGCHHHGDHTGHVSRITCLCSGRCAAGRTAGACRACGACLFACCCGSCGGNFCNGLCLFCTANLTYSFLAASRRAGCFCNDFPSVFVGVCCDFPCMVCCFCDLFCLDHSTADFTGIRLFALFGTGGFFCHFAVIGYVCCLGDCLCF